MCVESIGVAAQRASARAAHTHLRTLTDNLGALPNELGRGPVYEKRAALFSFGSGQSEGYLGVKQRGSHDDCRNPFWLKCLGLRVSFLKQMSRRTKIDDEHFAAEIFSKIKAW